MLPSRPSRGTLIAIALFVVVSALVVSTLLNSWDVAWLRAAAPYRTAPLTSIMRVISLIGNWQGEVPFALLVAFVLWRRQRGRQAATFLLAAVSGELLYAVLKLVFRRPRPTVIPHLAPGGWYSYPSGHSMLAPIIWGYGLLLLASLTPQRAWRTVGRVLAVIMVAAIATSRVYLGVHYVTDVIGGLCMGVAWMLWWSGAGHQPSSRA